MNLKRLDGEARASVPSLDDQATLTRGLEQIGAHENAFTEAFYALFFERRPDTLALFGVHSISEREEMMRETLHSLFAVNEGEPWLRGNLLALGESHAEYGVTADMYDSYCEVFVDTAQKMLGDDLKDRELKALRDAIFEVARLMREAGTFDDRAPMEQA